MRLRVAVSHSDFPRSKTRSRVESFEMQACDRQGAFKGKGKSGVGEKHDTESMENLKIVFGLGAGEVLTISSTQRTQSGTYWLGIVTVHIAHLAIYLVGVLVQLIFIYEQNSTRDLEVGVSDRPSIPRSP